MLLLLLSSCVSRKDVVYFQDLKGLQQEIAAAKEGIKIQPNDQLSITVSASNIEAVQPFNLPITTAPRLGDSRMVTGSMQMLTYLVDSDGNIEFPQLGTIHVAGKTRQELIGFLKEKISQYVQNPIINVQLTNFQVTILGEVNQPGTYSVPDERISLPKALGLAGDLNIYGKRDNIMILRETGDSVTYGYVDLRDSDLIDSEWYYLQQNDMVYVEPNKAQVQAAAYNRNASVYISVAGVIISVISVLIR